MFTVEGAFLLPLKQGESCHGLWAYLEDAKTGSAGDGLVAAKVLAGAIQGFSATSRAPAGAGA